MISFESASYNISEGAGYLMMRVTRSGLKTLPAMVLVATDNSKGTALG